MTDLQPSDAVEGEIVRDFDPGGFMIGQVRCEAHPGDGRIHVVIQDFSGCAVGFGTLPRDWVAQLARDDRYSLASTIYAEKRVSRER
jgi:hypothetical protein